MEDIVRKNSVMDSMGEILWCHSA